MNENDSEANLIAEALEANAYEYCTGDECAVKRPRTHEHHVRQFGLARDLRDGKLRLQRAPEPIMGHECKTFITPLQVHGGSCPKTPHIHDVCIECHRPRIV